MANIMAANTTQELISNASSLHGFEAVIREGFSRIILAAIVLLIGLVLGRVVGLIIANSLKKLQVNNILSEAFGIKYNVERIISNLASILIWVYTILLSLSFLGLSRIVSTIIGIIILVILVLSILLALRDLFPNLVMGLEIQRKELLKEGDRISVDKESAKVLEIGLLEVILEKAEGERIIIPNSILLRKEITVLIREGKKVKNPNTPAENNENQKEPAKSKESKSKRGKADKSFKNSDSVSSESK